MDTGGCSEQEVLSQDRAAVKGPAGDLDPQSSLSVLGVISTEILYSKSLLNKYSRLIVFAFECFVKGENMLAGPGNFVKELTQASLLLSYSTRVPVPVLIF